MRQPGWGQRSPRGGHKECRHTQATGKQAGGATDRQAHEACSAERPGWQGHSRKRLEQAGAKSALPGRRARQTRTTQGPQGWAGRTPGAADIARHGTARHGTVAEPNGRMAAALTKCNGRLVREEQGTGVCRQRNWMRCAGRRRGWPRKRRRSAARGAPGGLKSQRGRWKRGRRGEFQGGLAQRQARGPGAMPYRKGAALHAPWGK